MQRTRPLAATVDCGAPVGRWVGRWWTLGEGNGKGCGVGVGMVWVFGVGLGLREC